MICRNELILRDVEDWFDLHTSREPKDKGFFHPEARADYLAALRQPGTVTAICEDYRAAATIDLEHDRASRAAGEKITCPLLALWGAKGKIGQWYKPLEVWGQYASGPVSGRARAQRPLPGGGSAAGSAGGARRVSQGLGVLNPPSHRSDAPHPPSAEIRARAWTPCPRACSPRW
jgi:hypothetical protein